MAPEEKGRRSGLLPRPRTRPRVPIDPTIRPRRVVGDHTDGSQRCSASSPSDSPSSRRTLRKIDNLSRAPLSRSSRFVHEPFDISPELVETRRRVPSGGHVEDGRQRWLVGCRAIGQAIGAPLLEPSLCVANRLGSSG